MRNKQKEVLPNLVVNWWKPNTSFNARMRGSRIDKVRNARLAHRHAQKCANVARKSTK